MSHNLKINNFLKHYDLFSFHHRVLYKLFTFSFLIKNKQTSPQELKSKLEFESDNVNYNLRTSSKLLIKPNKSSSKHGDLTFKNLFAKLFNSVKSCYLFIENFKLNNFINYKSLLLLNINLFFNNFLIEFKQFNFEHSFYLINFKLSLTKNVTSTN